MSIQGNSVKLFFISKIKEKLMMDDLKIKRAKKNKKFKKFINQFCYLNTNCAGHLAKNESEITLICV